MAAARPHRLLARATAFSYACAGCGRCCHDKRITLSPYELLRLAAAKGVTTRTILEEHSTESGTALRFDEPGGCTFLQDGRCGVHGGRPLACRLYPLGRTLDADGIEAFIEVAPHPETEGIYGEDGTVDAWVAAQGARPFIEAAQKTYALFERLIALVDHGSVSTALGTSDPVASDWLDVDAVVTRACAEKKQLVPSDVEERFEIYLGALERWIDAESAREQVRP